MGVSRRRLLLGVDAGQTVTKAALFDLDGRQVGLAAERAPLSTPRSRWVERDLDAVWASCAAAIRACVGGAGAEVVAVGICGHNDGAYAVDAAGRPVRPAILAMDSRAHSYVDRFQQDDRALALTGQSPFPASPAAVYSWLRDHEPAALEATRWLLFCKDWLRYRLTGDIATDPTEASASFTDVHTQAYSPDAFALYGLADVAGKVPPIVGSAEVAGKVTAAAAAETGLAEGTPVVAGAHDVDAAALGMGAVGVGAVSMMMGTFSINQVVSDDVRLDHRWQARTFLTPGQWLNMATSPASSTNLEWFVRTLCRDAFERGRAEGDPYGFVADEAAATDDDGDPIVFLPFLFGSPHGADASAAFVGLRGWHTRGHLLRALLEGIVFNHRTHLDALRSGFEVAGAVRLGGGGARSPFWTQLMADSVELPMEVSDTDEPGARGAAVLAGLGVGCWASMDEAAAATVRVVRSQEPEAAGVERMARRWGAYQRVVDALRGAWPL
jgi:L-xylulokinase